MLQPSWLGALVGALALGSLGGATGYLLGGAQRNRNIAIGIGVGAVAGALAGHLLTRRPPPRFPNLRPAELVGDAQEYMAEWRRTRGAPWAERAYVVVYQRDPAEFRRRVRSRQKFLWTLDTDGFLSIGSPSHNKHAVVGAGKTVYAAGTGQLQMPAEVENYMVFEHLARQAFTGIQQGHTRPDNNPYIDMARDFAREHNIRGAPNFGALPDIVELDFDSGHYQPRDAWAQTIRAWNAAGFRVVRNPRGRHV
ncbi:hypothetical protein [Oceanibaculum nanhaiense]|uniref:hypothetical protein n=1 Tax=Oceanibaculum nanhaiense TaxID=1909734 RepID=UPI003D2C5A19